MNKPFVLSVMTAVILLVGSVFTPVFAQSPTSSDAPTFYRPIPGTYVNGWPRFTIHYPKDWVERRVNFGGVVFGAKAPEPEPFRLFSIVITTDPAPLDKWADLFVRFQRTNGATDVVIVTDKPSKLRDGTPAREVELQMVVNGTPVRVVGLATKKGGEFIATGCGSSSGKIEEYQKAILYSIEFQPDKDEPVKVPPDVLEFLDRFRDAYLAHDLAQVMTCYSDRFLTSGQRKGEMERFIRLYIGSVTSYEVTITDFVPAGDKAYLTGFVRGFWGKGMIAETSIIKENGEWKWHGNQRDPAR
jgi:hypothetical protein